MLTTLKSREQSQIIKIKDIETELDSQKEEFRKSKEKTAEEEKNSRGAHQELSSIRQTKNKIKECLTLMKHNKGLPLKKEIGKKVFIMGDDLKRLSDEVEQLENMRDSAARMTEHEKLKFRNLIMEADRENKSLRRDLEVKDRVKASNIGSPKQLPAVERVQEGV